MDPFVTKKLIKKAKELYIEISKTNTLTEPSIYWINFIYGQKYMGTPKKLYTRLNKLFDLKLTEEVLGWFLELHPTKGEYRDCMGWFMVTEEIYNNTWIYNISTKTKIKPSITKITYD